MFQRICPECGRAIDRQEGQCSICDELEPDTAPLLPLPPIQAQTLAFVTRSGDGPSFPDASPILPELGIIEAPELPLARRADYSAWALAQMRPADYKRPISGEISPIHTAPPSPAIPRDLRSLENSPQNPEIATVATAPPTQQPLARQSSWVLSLAIGAGIVAVTLGAAFYAIPSFAGTSVASPRTVDQLPDTRPPAVSVAVPTAAPEKTENPLASAIEVTGIRFITDVPNQHPQVHYLVVNHSANPVADVTVTVTLHPEDGSAPLSQFSFRVPHLEGYESKEMVNAIDQLKQSAATPDWRHTHVELTLAK